MSIQNFQLFWEFAICSLKSEKPWPLTLTFDPWPWAPDLTLLADGRDHFYNFNFFMVYNAVLSVSILIAVFFRLEKVAWIKQHVCHLEFDGKCTHQVNLENAKSSLDTEGAHHYKNNFWECTILLTWCRLWKTWVGWLVSSFLENMIRTWSSCQQIDHTHDPSRDHFPFGTRKYAYSCHL